MRTRFAMVAALVVACCFGARRSQAAPTPTPTPAATTPTLAATTPTPMRATVPNAKTEAHDRFAQGLRLYEKGENAAALAEFQRAYELIPSPIVLYNIGLVYAAMDRPVEAVNALDRFLAAGGSALLGEQGRRARQVRGEQAVRVSEVMVITNRPATIEVDGVEAGSTPLATALRVASGTHVVSAQAPGYLPLRQEVTLAGQVKETVTLTLLPAESTVAHLALTVSVPGAQVLVNGKLVGVSPLPASVAIAPGAATIEVQRAGYLSASRGLQLDEGSNGALTVALEEDPAAPATLKGRLRLSIAQPGAQVGVDGIPRPSDADGLALIGGAHIIHVERTGFVTFERTVEVGAGLDTTLAVDLVPTLETRQLDEDRGRTRRLWGWSAVGAGALVAAGAVLYAVATRDDLSAAEANLDAQLALEAMPAQHCSAAPSNVGTYEFFMCGQAKATLQDQVDTDKLRRDLAYAGMGLGLAVAGVGTYLLVTGQANRSAEGRSSQLTFWSDGRSGGLVAFGRF